MLFILGILIGCTGGPDTYGEDGVYSCTYQDKDAETENCACEPESPAAGDLCCDRLCDNDPDPLECTAVCAAAG